MTNKTTRNGAIDLLRALTMFMMLTVNDLWTVHGVPHWMKHAAEAEDMLGFSDIVFPSFLFCVGLSIPYAIHNMRQRMKSEGDTMRHILSRSFALLLMGAFICNYESGIDPNVGYDRNVYCILMTIAFFLVYNDYKSREWWARGLQITGCAILLYLLFTSRSPYGAMFSPSWWGILGLIGWAYLFCASVYALSTNWRTLAVVWVILMLICLGSTPTAPWLELDGAVLFPAAVNNAVQIVRSVLHLGNASHHLLVMSGILFSTYCLRKGCISLRTSMLLTVVFVLLGFASHQLFIVSKQSATLPWVFFVLAIDIALYALFDLLVRHQRSHWLAFLRPAGTATLTCYMIPYLFYSLISLCLGWAWSYAIPASFGILKCVAYAALCVLVTALLTKINIKLKI